MPALDRDQAEQALRAAEAEQSYWEAHYQEYLEQYPDQFVAVAGGKVIDVDADLEQLVRRLEQKEQDLRRVWVRYITANPHRVLL